MFIVVTITEHGWVTRLAAFASYDEALAFVNADPDICDSVWLIEYVEEDEDLFHSINH